MTADPRVRALMGIGRSRKSLSLRRFVRTLAPLREIREAGAPLWPADSGAAYLELLACGHYRRCESKCKARAHRCSLCARREG